MTRRGIPWQERLWSKVAPGAGGCLIWTSAINHRGYGLFAGPAGYGMPRFNAAHRWAYVAANGPIPDGLEVDHLCNVTACVNPTHLEAVTPEENKRRAVERRTHCKNGHEFTESNTYFRRDGGRKCRRCSANYARTGQRTEVSA